MAVLSDADRLEEWADLMRDMSTAGESCSISKAELRAALNAVDQWVSDNAASLNSAIPQPARGALTAAQKARILVRVVRRRFETGA